mmetsp:Transcript_58709/g.128947  ORF Transcript_58709/g.128947 Transcript_58709/m.128947 type:complete len:247 (-) Transcript_58709:110-850(-)
MSLRKSLASRKSQFMDGLEHRHAELRNSIAEQIKSRSLAPRSRTPSPDYGWRPGCSWGRPDCSWVQSAHGGNVDSQPVVNSLETHIAPVTPRKRTEISLQKLLAQEPAIQCVSCPRATKPCDDQGSNGSVGHPFTCAGPCKYFSKPRGCKDGASCNRCHICPWKRTGGLTQEKVATPWAPELIPGSVLRKDDQAVQRTWKPAEEFDAQEIVASSNVEDQSLSSATSCSTESSSLVEAIRNAPWRRR